MVTAQRSFMILAFTASLVACGGGGGGSSSGGGAATNSAPSANNVRITGADGSNAVVGDTLQGSYQFSDSDGDAEGASRYRWLRNGSAIASATGRSYVIDMSDAGHTLTFEVTPVATSGASDATPTVSSGVDVNDTPSVSHVSVADGNGAPVNIGDTLTGSYRYADAENDPEGNTTIRWLRNGNAIGGADTLSYVVASADIGQSIALEVTPFAMSGSVEGNTARSSALAVTNAPPRAVDVLVADQNGGATIAGDQLQVTYTYVDPEGDLEGTSAFQWRRNGIEIQGQTAQTYTVTLADRGQQIDCVVIPAAASGTTTGDASAALSITINDIPSVSAATVYDDNGGFPEVGDSLTALYIYIDPDDDPEANSTFRWFRDGTEVTGATNSSYVLSDDDLHKQISYEVTPVASAGDPAGEPFLSEPTTVGRPPTVYGQARYLDVNGNSIADQGDQIIVPFDQGVVVNAASPSNFVLPVSGDTFGGGAVVSAGPLPSEVTITLGDSPSVKSRQVFSTDLEENSPSGIDVSNAASPHAIENDGGLDAVASTPIDVVPGFVEGEAIFGASGPTAAGDFDGDGDLDLVVVGTGALYFYRNSRSASYTLFTSVPTADEVQDIALADFDKDGDLDLVLANNGDNRLFLNDGMGTFTDSSQVLGSGDSRSIAIGDVENDGDLDVVVGNYGEPSTVLRNDGSGTFTVGAAAVGNANTTKIVLADTDGDGGLDAVTANDSGQPNRVYLNSGNGVFSDSGQSIGSSDSTGLALGDIDNDGDLDLVVTNAGNQGNQIFDNDGTGNFSGLLQTFGSRSSNDVTLFDIDSDGYLDLVTANADTGDSNGTAYEVFFNSQGSFTRPGLPFGLGGASRVVLGDVDLDGDQDVIGPRSDEDNRVDLHLNSLSGTWGSTTFRASDENLGSGARALALGDFDGDGDKDIVVARSGNLGNQLYLNNGDGTFADSGQLLGAYSSWAVDIGDFDSDGDLDMVEARYLDEPVLYFNDGNGVFLEVSPFGIFGMGNSNSISVADVDSDGAFDFVVDDYDAGFEAAYNYGNGSFSQGHNYPQRNLDGWRVLLGDLDSDGDLDVFVVEDGGSNRIYWNGGIRSFSSGPEVPGFVEGGAAIADVDRDGDNDLILPLTLSNARVFLNSGSGGFSDSGQRFGYNINNQKIAMGDLNGDGFSDIVITTTGRENRVFFNDGTGNYMRSYQQLDMVGGSDVVIGDIDNDGDNDIVFSGYNEPSKVYLNQ